MLHSEHLSKESEFYNPSPGISEVQTSQMCQRCGTLNLLFNYAPYFMPILCSTYSIAMTGDLLNSNIILHFLSRLRYLI